MPRTVSSAPTIVEGRKSARLHQSEKGYVVLPGVQTVVKPRWRARFWRIVGGIVAAAIAIFYSSTTQVISVPKTAESPNWTLELSTPAEHSIRVLVYGQHAGLHFIDASPESDGSANRTTLPARLHQGHVWIVPLSFWGAEVRAKNPDGSSTLFARGYMIKVFENGVKVR